MSKTKKEKEREPVKIDNDLLDVVMADLSEPALSVTETEKEKPLVIKKTEISEPEKPVVSLKVFLQIFGAKWDQMAGFKHYAKKHKLEPLTVPQWRKAFAEFMDTPTE